MTNRHSIDHLTADQKAAAQRNPSASKARDRRRLQRTILARYGSNPPEGAVRGVHVRTDGVKAVTRRLAVKRVRAAGRMIGRWWKRYLSDFSDWMFDRTDSDEVGK